MRVLSYLYPGRPLSVVARYGATTAIVLTFCGLRFGLPMDDSPFLLFVPAVFIASLLFDRSCGFYATGLGTLLAVYLFMPPFYTLSIAPARIPSLVVFVVLCLGISVVNEGLRRALERMTATEAQATLLLAELGHRIRNNLHIAISMLTMQGRAHRDPTLQKAFDVAIGRIRVIANAHDRLQVGRKGEAVEMREYLEDLCRNLAETVREVRPIAVRVDADRFSLPTEVAVPIGLIVNELVTNAFKYAFPDEREGLIVVGLRRASEGRLLLRVCDNGTGCPDDPTEGLGSRLVRLLVQQLKGSVVRRKMEPTGCEISAELNPE
jgi:two-component sensor histidine kinase